MKKVKIKRTRDPELEARIAEFEAFADPAAWRRSRKGNLWRHYEGVTVSIFTRRDDMPGWSIADADGTRFSHGGFFDEEEAMGDLADELGF